MGMMENRRRAMPYFCLKCNRNHAKGKLFRSHATFSRKGEIREPAEDWRARREFHKYSGFVDHLVEAMIERFPQMAKVASKGVELPKRKVKEMVNKIKCVRTSSMPANTKGWKGHKVETVELGYDLHVYKGPSIEEEWIRLIGGPTGYEEAPVKSLAKWAFSLKTRLHLDRRQAWAANYGSLACSSAPEYPSEDNGGMGVPGGFSLGYDKLDVPAREIRRIFKLEGKVK